MPLLGLALEVAGLLGFTWYALAQYKDAHVTRVVHGAVFLSWVLGFLGLLLLPMDLVRNGLDHREDQDASSSDRDQAFAEYLDGWKALYWITFALSWLVLPFLVEFCQNGEFVLEKRIISSLLRLLMHWTILLALGGCLMMYLILIDHFSFYGLVGLTMASANTYGLLWLICLLGYGLVAIPRSLWMLRYPESRLKELYFRAVQVHDDRMEAMFEYDEAVSNVRECYDRMLVAESAAIVLTGDMQFVKTCLLQVIAQIDQDPSNSSRYVKKKAKIDGTSASRPRAKFSPLFSTTLAPSCSNPPSMPEVVELHRRVRHTQSNMRCCEQMWLELCIRAETLQDTAQRRELPPACLLPDTTPLNRVQNMLLTTRYQLRRMFTAPLSIVCAVVTGICSLCVLWAEFTMGWWSSFSPLRWISHVMETTMGMGTGGSEILTLGVLLYLVLCTYSSLFTLRLARRFSLHSHHNSSSLSLLKTSIHQCRLQFALGYNFLLLLKDPATTRRTAFFALFREMQIVHVLGRDFSVYAPIVMVLLVAFSVSNAYARVMKQLGIEQYDEVIFGQHDHEQQITRGESLVAKGLETHRRVISRKKREYENSSSAYGYALSSSRARGLLENEELDDDEETDRGLAIPVMV